VDIAVLCKEFDSEIKWTTSSKTKYNKTTNQPTTTIGTIGNTSISLKEE
jgi:hypothetical protein